MKKMAKAFFTFLLSYYHGIPFPAFP